MRQQYFNKHLTRDHRQIASHSLPYQAQDRPGPETCQGSAKLGDGGVCRYGSLGCVSPGEPAGVPPNQNDGNEESNNELVSVGCFLCSDGRPIYVYFLRFWARSSCRNWG